MGETSGGATAEYYTHLESSFHAQHFIRCLYASILNRIEVIKLQSYDNRKIAKTLTNKKRDLRTVAANLHESLTQCT